MRKAIITGVLATSMLLPAVAHAQAAAPAAPPAVIKTEPLVVIRPAQVLAIGAGVIVGVVVAEALVSTELGLLAGGAIGGYLANIWYGGGQLELHTVVPPKI